MNVNKLIKLFLGPFVIADLSSNYLGSFTPQLAFIDRC